MYSSYGSSPHVFYQMEKYVNLLGSVTEPNTVNFQVILIEQEPS